ncbi:MAG: alpha-2-macroglobulin family protein [Xanthobacteraceae bacterium]
MNWLAPYLALAFSLAAVAAPAAAQTPPQLDRLQRADGARIVPERFLRSWDPVTLFFDRDVGPAAGGPEDAPERLVTMQPATPGAWQWLGSRALQFRPADAWKPLQPVEIAAEGARARLIPLLPVPVSTSPPDQADGITDLDQIALTFEDPVDVGALSRQLTIELRPTPGTGGGGGQILGAGDVSVEPVERARNSDKQTYLLKLKTAVPDGRVVVVRLKLSDQPGLDDQIFELQLHSAVPFAVTGTRCGRGLDRDTVDGVMQCSQFGTAASSADDAERPGTQAARRRIAVGFSARPETLDVVRAREVLRITPAVDDLAIEPDASRLQVAGKFLADTVYELRIAPGSIRDQRNRLLEGPAFVQKFSFAPETPSLKWDASQGIAERFGPQLVPLRGGGYERADVRIYAVDPLSRDFWPFPRAGVETSDDESPPLPGNEPGRWTRTDDTTGQDIAARIKALGSPAVSELLPLPIRRGGAKAKFGIDLKPLFTKIAGAEQPGTYLVGLRAVDGGKRHWLRVQVTDLTLSTVEEASRVRFAVTSLATVGPIAGAEIRLEGVREKSFVTLARGLTDADGGFTWSTADRTEAEIKRIVVTKGLDTLVLEPGNGPSEYSAENWTRPEKLWLSWTVDPRRNRGEARRTLCHLFTERPIYRPEEPVHIKGYVRTYLAGKLAFATGSGTLLVTGPSNQEWRIPIKLDASGNLYHKLDVATPATGDYTATYEPDGAQTSDNPAQDGDDDERAAAAKSCGQVPFKKEAYRLPTFEVLLNGPERVALDDEFSVDLVARYFAGGLVADRPVKFRATQFPHAWTPPGRDGFLFSTDARFSSDGKFRSTPVLEREARTDASGSARITFDTTVEPTAQPRRYLIEATVTGDDDIQVRNLRSVVALPAFVLGVKVPRYVARSGTVEPDILAVNAVGEPLAGVPMTVRFIRRNWVSTLQASDFSQGAAKYVTEVVDETVVERKLISTAEPQRLSLEAREAGVYLVQVEAVDRVGRRQQVTVDFFVGGDTPVTWSRPPAQTATIGTDKESYAPGETATLLIESPFQTARALAVVEQPEGRFRYDWVDITNGFGRYPLRLRPEDMPRLAVHLLIMRGRLADTGRDAGAPFDQGKPVTIAATKWITVTPVKNIVTVGLDHPHKARPGQEIEVTLRLADDLGQPVAGEATFWMVDQAVLSLAKERPLDPLPSFIVERPTRMAARDTRNMAFGVIPLEEVPGGDEALDEWGTENNVSVRKNFTPVPIYLPTVVVGADGVAKIKVRLPDSLTVFKLRAKAISGPDRFGYATGEMLVRQDLVAQPALPRFVRPGDTFDAGLIGRVIEGPTGTGRAGLAVEGLVLDGAGAQRFSWTQNRPARIDFPATVAEPLAGRDTVRLRFSLQRDADHAADNVQIDLPVRPDRSAVRRREIVDLPAGGSVRIPALAETPRPGSFVQTVTLAADPTLVRLVAGLNYLVAYPFGCTEQRIALAGAALALKSFAPILAAAGLRDRVSGDVRNTLRAIEQSIDPDGLVAFWPRARGNVSLTAWAYGFAVAAEKAGEPVDKALSERLAKVLRLALRSDYARLLDGEAMRERVEALTALAEGGKLEQAYVAELARRAAAMPNVSVAQLASAVASLPGDDRRMLGSLLETLWSRVKILSRDGRLVYAGQAADGGNPVILPSEARSLSEITRAVALAAPEDPRLEVLRDGLLRISDGSGWGSTNANAAAVRALATLWQKPSTGQTMTVMRGAAAERLVLDGDTPVAVSTSGDPAETRIEHAGNAAIVALVDSRYQPATLGSRAQPIAQGFVVTRQSYRVPAGGAPIERMLPDADGALQLKVGDVIEEVAELVNPEDRTHVAFSLPLAAGLEPLNPGLATAPAEATPSSGPTLPPTWVSYGDDRVFFAYDSLPKGNYRFVVRTRALIRGSFTQPPGEAETMYQAGIYGASAGQRIVVSR